MTMKMMRHILSPPNCKFALNLKLHRDVICVAVSVHTKFLCSSTTHIQNERKVIVTD